MSQVTGTVKFFNVAKGWGMITPHPDDGQGEYFVHHSVIKADGFRVLNEGDLVSFMPCTGSKGRYADNVILVKQTEVRKF